MPQDNNLEVSSISLTPSETAGNDEASVVVYDEWNELQQEAGQERLDLRRGQIKQMELEGKSPKEIFIEIHGERSRADNVYCGVNGEADHQSLVEYFNYLLSTPDLPGAKRHAYEFVLSNMTALVSSRAIVKDLLIAEQLTDPSQYKMEGSSDRGLTLNSALIEAFPETDRIWNGFVRNHWANLLSPLQESISEWQQLRTSMASYGIQILPYVYPPEPERFRTEVENGSRNTSFIQALENPQDFFNQGLIDQIEQGQPSLRSFLEGITYAQGVLEHQAYFVGVGVLNAADNGVDINTLAVSSIVG